MTNILSVLRSKKDIKSILSWVWLIGGYLWTIWYQVFRGQDMLDSDMSFEMIQAHVLNKEHSPLLISKNIIYSTELRFLDMQLFYRIGLAIFPHNWHLARTFSMAIAIALLAFAVWLVFYAIDESPLGIWAAAMTIFPGGAYYFWQTIYGGYYLTTIFFSLFTISLSLLVSRDLRRPRNIIYLIIIVIIGVSSGLNSIKQLMIFYVPFVVSCCFFLLTEIHNEDQNSRNRSIRLFILSLIGAFSSFVGYIINSRVLSKIYQFDYYGDTEIEAGSFFEVMREYIWCFGFTYEKKLMSFVGIASMIGVLIGLFTLFSGAHLAFRYRRLTYGQKYLFVTSAGSILVCGFTFTFISDGSQYFKALVPFGYCLVLIELQTIQYVFKHTRFVAKNLILVTLLITSLGTVYNENHGVVMHPYRAQPNLNALVTWLKGGYTDGISLFWTSNVVVELSDGAIDMWSLKRHPEYKDDWLDWETTADHMGSFPSGRYFYLVDNKEIEREDYGDEYAENRDNFLNEHPGLIEIYSDGEYTVYANY